MRRQHLRLKLLHRTRQGPSFILPALTAMENRRGPHRGISDKTILASRVWCHQLCPAFFLRGQCGLVASFGSSRLWGVPVSLGRLGRWVATVVAHLPCGSAVSLGPLGVRSAAKLVSLRKRNIVWDAVPIPGRTWGLRCYFKRAPSGSNRCSLGRRREQVGDNFAGTHD